jgi:hypothetical protein
VLDGGPLDAPGGEVAHHVVVGAVVAVGAGTAFPYEWNGDFIWGTDARQWGVAGVVPERVGIAAGPNEPLLLDGLNAYREVLSAAMGVTA